MIIIVLPFLIGVKSLLKGSDFISNIIMNQLNILEKEIQQMSETMFADDNCKPKFFVSLNNEDMKNQKILITIDHLGYKFTEVLFPRDDTFFGYDSIEHQMQQMYNKTM